MKDLELIIVEDDPIYQGIYIEAIHGAKAHLTFCGTVSLAVSLCSLITPDVIIVDLGLPDGDGVEAIQKIRENDESASAYVIVATGSTNSDEHQRALDAGANKVLVKPIDSEDLQSTLQALSAAKS